VQLVTLEPPESEDSWEGTMSLPAGQPVRAKEKRKA
jgi:hypothetical protein